MKLSITIPKRSDKLASQIKDGLRIIAWQEYKNEYSKLPDNEKGENPLKGLELYEEFKKEWNKHNIQTMELNELDKFLDDLGYSRADIADVRAKYYQARNEFKAKENGNLNHELSEEKMPF